MTRPDPSESTPVPMRAETFACEGLESFLFDFPIFEDWEVKRIEPTGEGRCRILLNWPMNVEFEVAPQVYIQRRDDLRATTPEAVAAIHATHKTTGQTQTAANPNTVLFDRVHNATRWTAGYVPKPDQWDYLQFYGPVFGVRIGVEAWGDEHGFSRARFADEIIRTFRFSPGA